MKTQLYVLLTATAVIGMGCFANAETIFNQAEIQDVGTVDGAYWALSDGGFALTGDALAQTMLLESVAFARDTTNLKAPGTQGNLYLKVFTGSSGGQGTFLGISNNTVDFYALSQGQLGTWTFDGLALDKDTVYSYVASVNNDTSDPIATIRILLSAGTNPLSTGGALIDDAEPWGGDWDPTVTVVASAVPEPGCCCLFLAMCITAALPRFGWRKR